jgi:hypothetical protein
MVFHFFRRLTLSLFHEIAQYEYKMLCDQVQVFLGIFQRIAGTQTHYIYCFLQRRIQQEKHVPQFKEP